MLQENNSENTEEYYLLVYYAVKSGRGLGMFQRNVLSFEEEKVRQVVYRILDLVHSCSSGFRV
jgi:hypothetical protein